MSTWEEEEKAFFAKMEATKHPATVRNYRKHLRTFREFWLSCHDSMPNPSTLKEEDLYPFLKYLKSGKWDPNYYRRIYLSLIIFLEFCRNPNTRYMRENIPREVVKPIGYYTQEEINYMLNYYPEDDIISMMRRVYLHLIAYLGLRPIEVNHLTWDAIDLDKHVLRVKGKKGKERTAYIPKDICKLLKKYKDMFNSFMETRKAGGLNITDALFFKISKDITIKEIGERTMYSIFYHDFRGKIPHFNLKKFRSTLAKTFVDNKISIEIAARQLGHASTKTTRRYYADLTIDMVKDAYKAMRYGEGGEE